MIYIYIYIYIKFVHNVPVYTGCPHFKVSSDEQFVRRGTPLSEPSNVDERTLYVVSLNCIYH